MRILGPLLALAAFCAPLSAQTTSSCTWDDGVPEGLLCWTSGGDIVWLNRFGAPGTTTVVSDLSVIWGALGTNLNPGNGTPTDVCLWLDGPSQDGDPSDATLVVQIATTVSQVNTNIYVTFPIAPLSIAGYFFVGTHQIHNGLSGLPPSQWVVPMDTSTQAGEVSWIFGNNSSPTAPANLASPGANVQPPQQISTLNHCQVCVRAGCVSSPAVYLCDPGAAGVSACPCANPPAGGGRGCNNSAGTGGASIQASGSNSLSAPTLALTSAGEPPSATSILLQGSALDATGASFGQGVRCAGGALKRLYVKVAAGGSVTLPDFAAGALDIPTRSANLGDPIGAGQHRWYLVYYRDPVVLGGCPSTSTFNATNTADVLWSP